MGEDAPLRDTVVRDLHARTGGNPLFVAELARAAADAPAEAATAVPEGVREAVLRRLTPLGDESRRALDAAAVLSRPFTVATVARIAGLPPQQARAALEPARVARLVTDVPDAPGRLAFAHAIVRDAVREALPPARRGPLHAAVVERAARQRRPPGRGRAPRARGRPRGGGPPARVRAVGRGRPGGRGRARLRRGRRSLRRRARGDRRPRRRRLARPAPGGARAARRRDHGRRRRRGGPPPLPPRRGRRPARGRRRGTRPRRARLRRVQALRRDRPRGRSTCSSTRSPPSRRATARSASA